MRLRHASMIGINRGHAHEMRLRHASMIGITRGHAHEKPFLGFLLTSYSAEDVVRTLP